MDKFKRIQEAKTTLKVNIEPILSLAKECLPDIPVRVKAIDSKYDTTGIAEAILNGAYLLEHKYESYLITAEDVAKVPGFNDVIKSGKGDIKIGRRGFKFNVNSGTLTSAKTYKLEVFGDIIEDVIPNKLDAATKKLIKEGPVVYALKSKLSQGLVDATYDGQGDDFKQGFYIRETPNGIYTIMMSSHDITKGESFYIYGQQHASKRERFVYVNMDRVKYVKLSKYKVQPPRAYKKGYVLDRSDGLFIAK